MYRNDRNNHSALGSVPKLRHMLLAARISLVIGAGVMSGFATCVHAQPSASLARTYDIPSQQLSSALSVLESQGGLKFIMSPDLATDVTAGEVVGQFTTDEALNRLLGGTGVKWQTTDSGAVMLSSRLQPAEAGIVQLDEVLVEGTNTLADKRELEDPNGPGTGYVAYRTTAGSKTNAAIIDIPQSISVVTRQQMDDLGSGNVNKALRYTPGIISESKGAALNSGGGSSMLLRGFNPDFYLDGLKMDMSGVSYGTEVVEPYLLDRIEVVSGPASVLYGQASPGGLVNLASKLPTADSIKELQVSAGNHDRYRLGFDVGGALDENESVLYRVTGVGLTEGSQVDFIKTKRLAIAPSLTLKLSPDTKLTFLSKYIDSPDTGITAQLPAYGTAVHHVAGHIPTSFNVSDPNIDSSSQKTTFLGYTLEHYFTEDVFFRQNLRYGTSEADARRLALTPIPSSNASTALQRRGLYSSNDMTRFTVDNQVGTNFYFDDMTLNLLSGIDYQSYRGSSTYGQQNSVPPIDWKNPVYGVSIPNLAKVDRQRTDTDLSQLGAYTQAMLVTGGWHFMLGGRFDDAKSDSSVRAPGVASSRQKSSTDNSKFTWRAGALYQFENGLAPYISYSTSFVPSVGTDFGGQAYEPTLGKQVEAGIKYQPNGYDGFFTASVYQLTEENVLTVDTDHPGYQLQSGEVEVKGLELSAHANLTENLSAVASYTYTDAEATKSNATRAGIDGIVRSAEGHSLPGIPKNSASLLLDYDFQNEHLSGLSVNGGARYVGSTPGDDTNSFTVPSSTIFDLGLRYDLGKVDSSLVGALLQLNASNLFDKTYTAGCSGVAFCYLGERRNLAATLTYRW